jgi:DNA-directed RNA polymerase subunit M
MFCPKCGSILLPKREGNKIIIKCSCGYTSDDKVETRFSETAKKVDERKHAAVEEDIETLPLTDAECPKCKHKTAYFWEVQTRSADEAPTKFMKCEKCKHIWRDYN